MHSDATIKEVAEILSKKEFHAIPVVDNEDLVGIVTTTDFINFLLEQLLKQSLDKPRGFTSRIILKYSL